MQPVPKASILFLWCFCSRICSAADTITVSQSIKDPESIVSEGKIFKFGFFSPDNSSNHRYVGIMYNIPLSTVVWVANRDKPITDSNGTVTISEDGNLVVLGGDKEMIWSSNVSNSSVANSSAKLLDTGSLVLRDNSNTTIWESFQYPTDCFLWSMQLGRDTNGERILTSWKSPTDPSIGSFTFILEPLGVPQFLIRNGTRTFWRSGPWNGQVFIGIPYMQSAYQSGFVVINDKAGAFYMTFSSVNTSVFTFFNLDSVGKYVQKIWDDTKEDWEVAWTAQNNDCDVYDICGPFGFCNPKDSPICSCLKGFEPKNKNEWNVGNWSSGCIRKTVLQCERNNSIDEDGKQDRFLKLATVKVPDFAELTPSVEEDCESTCLETCSCTAYSYDSSIGCMHWKEALTDTQQFYTGEADLYVRLAYSEFDDSNDFQLVTALTVTIGSITIAICGYFLLKWLATHKGRKQIDNVLLSKEEDVHPIYPTESVPKDTIDQYKFDDLPVFDFKMISNATGNFHLANKLGEGGFGPVYKGKLPSGQEIAVKRLSKSSGQGLEEFMNEVVLISKLQHRNLVRLLGCCIEREEKMLIYEFMPNGSLDAYLFDSVKKESVTWSQCTKIIEGIGRGLLYLHRDSRLKVIHRDLKASNILLDEEMNPKISDFGMARILEANKIILTQEEWSEHMAIWPLNMQCKVDFQKNQMCTVLEYSY